MKTYSITLTRRGDYLVRDHADRQLGRFETEEQAEAHVEQLKANDESARRHSEQWQRNLEALKRRRPDLVSLQLQWQAFRSHQYERYRDDVRHMESEVRSAELRIDTGPAQGAGQEQIDTAHARISDATRMARESEQYYNRLVSLDTRIKKSTL